MVRRLLIILCLLTSVAEAQLVIDEIPRGMYYDRTARVRKFKDMKNMRDVFHYDGLLMGRNRITGSIANNFGRIILSENGKETKRFRSAMSYFIRFRFFEEYSINLTFFHDLNRRAIAPWSPNFNYAIGRYQWRSKKFNYGYENYQPTRFNDPQDKLLSKLLSGYYFISYSHLMPDSLRKYIAIDSLSNIKFTWFARYYLYHQGQGSELQGGTFNSSKPIVGMAWRYLMGGRKFYVEFSPLFYLKPENQQPWDPDFTYGFGYFDYRAFRVSASYGNYNVNRWPWNKQTLVKNSFWDGNFKVSFNWVW